MIMIPVVLAALSMAGVPGGTVTCDNQMTSSAGADGLAFVVTQEIYLSDRICRDLRDRSSASGWVRPASTWWYMSKGEGYAVILHESAHLAGISEECEAEQWAMDHVLALAHRMHMSPKDTRMIMSGARLHHALLPPSYISCEGR